MENLPSVTIGIPVFNEERFIADTILSAINQTYENVKIVISDNCSTDKTFQIIKEIVDNHDQVTLIRQEKNIGIAANLNFLSQNAGTDFFCWLSGHDLLHKDFISAAVKVFMENSGLSLVYPRSEEIDEKGKLLNRVAHDAIDTTALDSVEGPLKVARNICRGTPIHGLWLTGILHEYEYKPFFGSDFTVVHHASVSGKIFELPEVYHFLRVIRKKTFADDYQRNHDFGLQARYANPSTEMCNEYMRYTLFSKKLKLVPKIKLLLELPKVLEMRYGYVHPITRIYSLNKRIRKKFSQKRFSQSSTM